MIVVDCLFIVINSFDLIIDLSFQSFIIEYLIRLVVVQIIFFSFNLIFKIYFWLQRYLYWFYQSKLIVQPIIDNRNYTFTIGLIIKSIIILNS